MSRPEVFGEYLLLKQLATHASADVFLARLIESSDGVPSPVILKRLHAELEQDEAFTRRFEREARIAVAVDAPNVAKLYDAGRVGTSYFLAFEYIAGWTLARVMSDLEAARTFASFDSIRDIMSDLLEGLRALHEARDPRSGQALGIVVRDVAPRNVMLGEDGRTRIVELGSLGPVHDWTTDAGMSRTHGYLSPEQARGEPPGVCSDLYSAGVILWELLTGKRYIERGPALAMLEAEAAPQFRPPSNFRSEASARIDAVLERALAIEPRARFTTASEFRAAIHEAFGSRDHDRPSSSLIGDLLWGELGNMKTEMTSLLVLDLRDAKIPTSNEKTLTLARRMPALTPRLPHGAPTLTQVPVLAPIDMSSTDRLSNPRSSGRVGWLGADASPIVQVLVPMTVAVVVCALCAWLIIAPPRLPDFAATRASPDIELAPPRIAPPTLVEDTGPSAPSVAIDDALPPMPTAVVARTATAATSSVSALADAQPPKVAAARELRRTSRPKLLRAPSPLASTDPVVQEVSPRERLKRLIEHARALESRWPPESNERRDLTRLMGDLSIEMNGDEIDGDRVAALERDLARFDSSSESR